MRCFLLFVLLGWAAGAPCRAAVSPGDLESADRAPGVRLNQIQVVGTHNSYHLEPWPAVLELKHSELFRKLMPDATGAAAEYSHPSLTAQLARQQVRQLELDLFPDPAGGLYVEPLAVRLVRLHGGQLPLEERTAALRAPGFKIMHNPWFDYRSTVPNLSTALREVRAWSQRNPHHVPVMILLELKSGLRAPPDLSAVADAATRALIAHAVVPPEWDAAQLAALEREILAVFPREALLTPDDVRGGAATLREAVLTRGWPELDAVRGRVMFTLDNESAVRDRYLGEAADLKGRLIFVSVPETHPAAAWLKINDPVKDFERIRALVRRGFLVRTRADEELREARANDSGRRDRAFASGAQVVSTDFPEPDSRYSAYCVQLPGRAAASANPVAGH